MRGKRQGRECRVCCGSLCRNHRYVTATPAAQIKGARIPAAIFNHTVRGGLHAIRLNQNYGQCRSCDLTDELISAPRQCLDKSWIFRRVAERLTNFVNGGIQVVIDINKGVGPEALLQLLAGDDFAMLLEQNDEYLESLRSTSA